MFPDCATADNVELANTIARMNRNFRIEILVFFKEGQIYINDRLIEQIDTKQLKMLPNEEF